MPFFDCYLEVEKETIHYLDNQNNSESLILIFPPGIQDGRFVYDLNLSANLLKKYRVICLSYPSRYKSEKFRFVDNTTNLAVAMGMVLRKLQRINKFKNIKLVGCSFGTSLITRLVQLYNFKYVTKIILFNPGEYFVPSVKHTLKVIFYPALKSRRYAKFLKYVLVKVLRIFGEEFFPEHRLRDINEQWMATLRYRISDKAVSKVRADYLLVMGKRDNVIDKHSEAKLLKVLRKAKVLTYDGGHIFNYTVSKEYLGGLQAFLFKELL